MLKAHLILAVAALAAVAFTGSASADPPDNFGCPPIGEGDPINGATGWVANPYIPGTDPTLDRVDRNGDAIVCVKYTSNGPPSTDPAGQYRVRSVYIDNNIPYEVTPAVDETGVDVGTVVVDSGEIVPN